MRLPVPFAAMLLAGCGGGSEANRNMTREEVTAEIADVRVSPGEWEQVTQVLRVEAPEMPRELATQMQQRRSSYRYCISPEQAAQPARVSNVIARPNAGCTVSDFTMRDGRMEGSMVCREGTPAAVTTAMSGNYAPDRFDYRSEVTLPAPVPGGTIRVEARTVGRRIGPCPAQGGQQR